MLCEAESLINRQAERAVSRAGCRSQRQALFILFVRSVFISAGAVFLCWWSSKMLMFLAVAEQSVISR